MFILFFVKKISLQSLRDIGEIVMNMEREIRAKILTI